MMKRRMVFARADAGESLDRIDKIDKIMTLRQYLAMKRKLSVKNVHIGVVYSSEMCYNVPRKDYGT